MTKPKILIEELFITTSSLLLIFAFLEYFWPYIVIGYINISFVLIFWLATAMMLLLLTDEKR